MPALDFSLTQVPAAHITTESIPPLLSLSLSLVSTLPGISGVPTFSDNTAGPSSTTAPPSVSWSKHSQKTVPLGDGAKHETWVYKATIWKEPWLARRSVSKDVEYETVRRGLFEEKVATENATVTKEQDVNQVVDQRQVGEWRVQDISKLLHVQAFSARTFLQTVIYHEGPSDKGKRWFMVVSVPTEKEAEGVRGVYSCVELVQETDDGTIEVVSLLTSDAGGSIPRFVQNVAMPTQIVADNNAFFQWTYDQKHAA